MIVLAMIDELQTITLAPLKGRHRGLRIHLSVDGPFFHAAMPAESRLQYEWNVDDVRCTRLRIGGRCRERIVSPDKLSRLLPFWAYSLARVFDGDCHSGRLDVLAHFTQHPDSGIVHLYHRADTLCGRQAQHGDRRRR